jgi:hypothetical protein
MKTWFSSQNGAITLSAVALVVFIARSLLDFQFVMPEFFSATGQVAMWIVIYMAFFGGWLWGLLAAVRGSRRGLIAALVFTLLLPVGGGIGTLVAFCPSPCPTAWPLGEIVNWLNLLSGLLAATAAGLHIWQGRKEQTA